MGRTFLGSIDETQVADLSGLSRKELHDLRLELTKALFHPGIEFEAGGKEYAENRRLYIARIEAIKTILGPD